MSYADERMIFDADSHLMELPDYLREFADPDIRDRLPKLGETSRKKRKKHRKSTENPN